MNKFENEYNSTTSLNKDLPIKVLDQPTDKFYKEPRYFTLRKESERANAILEVSGYDDEKQMYSEF